MNLRTPVVLLLLISVISLFSQNSFRFVFLADVHYHDKEEASIAMDIAIDSINALKPDFVLIGGDMVYDALRRTEEEAVKQAEDFIEKAEKFEMPLFYAIGNHDHFGVYDKNTETDHRLYGKSFYEHFFGERFYSFNHKGWHFITLDNMVLTEDRRYIGRVDSVQLDWLKVEIEQIPDTVPVALMVHVPLITTLSQWYGGGTTANTNRVAIENSDEVIKLFKDKNLRLILQGHVHYYEVMDILNKTTIISAPSFSGKWWLGPMNGLNPGFVIVDVMDDTITTQYVDYLN